MNFHLERAKEIFFNASCNHFHLDREFDADEYRKFNISREQENLWTREYILHWISQLSVDDLSAIGKLKSAYAGEALPKLFILATQGDSFAKFMYADAIWHLARGASISTKMREQAIQKAIDTLQSILKQPISITESHRLEIVNTIRDVKQYDESVGNTPEKYILQLAKMKLAEIQKKC
jgi:hypothetical protein